METDRHTLFLEDYDHLLEEVDCSESVMTIAFRDTASYSKARTACEKLANGLVVSSHSTCSDTGAHAVFSILNLRFDPQTLRIALDVEASALGHAFTPKTFDYGQTNDPHVIHQHDRLSRRSNRALSHVTERALSAIEDAETKPDTVNLTSLRFSETNTTFKFPGDVPFPFDLGCNNCSGKGDLAIKSASIAFNPDLGIFGGDDDPFQKGFVEIGTTGFELSIDLRAKPTPQPSLDFNIFEQQLTGVTIPGVGSMGLAFELDVEFQAEVDKDVELAFGFDLSMANSSIRVDIGEVEDSGIKGFDPTITAKPLRSNASDVDAFLVANFKSKLPISFHWSFLLAKGDVAVGAFMSLPNMNVNVTHPNTNVTGADCNEGNNTTTITTDDRFKDKFVELTHVVYNVSIGAGIAFDVPFLNDKTFLGNHIDVATQCLVYQTEGTSVGLTVATAVLASITATPIPTPTPTPAPTSSAGVADTIAGSVNQDEKSAASISAISPILVSLYALVAALALL
ncbi:hypothetical protein K504DRAFT_43393 [Pleomassaria siparia CBS 279.74]|uniref:GPI anchored protein n=1 Tax=Pleomassaria siparia CBS 279.74 TaxID=1314801 RepID=A0A6G1K4N1_9PLEO|nr:hypothetical protein K504DRAFT_43393 [Pleomassaria siparia CBS 279.74]